MDVRHSDTHRPHMRVAYYLPPGNMFTSTMLDPSWTGCSSLWSILIEMASSLLKMKHQPRQWTSFAPCSLAQACLPEQLVSDNDVSSPWSLKVVRKNSIKHITSVLYHPAANGLAESCVQSFKQLKTMGKEGK